MSWDKQEARERKHNRFASSWLERLRSSWEQRFPACTLPQCPHSGKLRLQPRLHGTFLNDAWYCSELCFDLAIQSAFHTTAVGKVPSPSHRLPLGLILLSRQQITSEQLCLALARQNAQGRGLIGFWLQELGYIRERDILSALSLQCSCPVISVLGLSLDQCLGILPTALILDLRLLPLQFPGKPSTIYAAFNKRVDYVALNVIESMLNYRTEQCLISDTEMEFVLARTVELAGPSLSGGNDVVFQESAGAEQMARLVCDYTLRLQAHTVKIAPCGSYFWVRLQNQAQFINLLISRCRPDLSLAARPLSSSEDLTGRHFQPKI